MKEGSERDKSGSGEKASDRIVHASETSSSRDKLFEEYHSESRSKNVVPAERKEPEIIAQIPLTVDWVSASIFRARGNTIVPMLTMMLGMAMVVLLNVILCIYPFHVGISGLGMSMVIACSLTVALSLYLQSRSEMKACLALNGPGPSKDWFIRIMKIGIPACISDLCWVGSNFILFYILGRTLNPTACQAAWTIGFRLHSTIGNDMVGAIGNSVETIVGQNLGAKNPGRAEKGGWLGTAIGAGYNFVVGIILFFAAGQISSLLSTDPLVIRYSTQYLQIVGVSLPFSAVWSILGGAMAGAGYTRWPMTVTVLALVVVRLPLAWFLTVTLGFDQIGTWSSLAASCALVGLLHIWLFKRGSWKLQEI